MQGTWGGHLQRPNLELPHRQNYWKRESNFRIHPEKHQNEKPEGERNSLQYACPPSAGVFCPVWDTSSKDKRLQLEKIQRRAARWTTSNYDTRSSVTAMLNQLGWRTLEQRRADARLCLFYKIVYGLVAVPLPNYVQPTHRMYRYCHSMTYRQIQTSTNYYKYSFFPLAIVQWNALPEAVASLSDLDLFKVAVSKLQHTRP